MRDEYHPLIRLRRGDDLSLGGRRWAISFAKYPAARSSVMSFSLMEETIHLPWPPDPDMIECFLEMEKMGTWALELENGRTERKRKRG